MNKLIFLKFLPVLFFGAVLMKEVASYLLYLYPSNIFLWRISLEFGDSFMPFVMLLNQHIGFSFLGNVLALNLMIALALYAYFARSDFLSNLLCHLALLLFAFGLLTNGFLPAFYYSIASSQPLVVGISRFITFENTLDSLVVISLFVGCAQGHMRYMRDVRRDVRARKVPLASSLPSAKNRKLTTGGVFLRPTARQSGRSSGGLLHRR